LTSSTNECSVLKRCPTDSECEKNEIIYQQEYVKAIADMFS